MFEQMAQPNALITAFEKVKRNRGCGGVDEVTIVHYAQYLASHTDHLLRQLCEGTYAPLPVKRAFIPKSNGQQRPLGIPAVRDRIVQQAALDVIQPAIDPLFSATSYGFRPHRSAIQAVQRVQKCLDMGYAYVVDVDIKDFFGTLSHRILMDKVRRTIPDRRVTRLIWQFLKAGIMEEGKLRAATSGTPQGGVISPLLANLYLNEFDHSLEKTEWKLVRYADDFVILCRTVNQAVQAMRTVRAMLRGLRLAVAEDKTRVAEYRTGFEFLGYRFQQYHGNYKWPRKKAVDAFKDKVRHATRRQQPKNVKMVIEKLNPVIRGWGHYFKYGNVKKRFAELDGWVRMRLRSFVDKQKPSISGIGGTLTSISRNWDS